jgi:predicted RNA-binding protein with PIN domain
MALIIDGHNLIGAGVFSDIRLSDEDDEARLVARLKVWKSRYRGKMTVIFDRGISGGRDLQLSGAGVEVIFAARPAEADDLIRQRIRRQTAGLILVTNDDALLREAAAYGVESWRGEELARRLTLSSPPLEDAGEETHVRLSAAEVDEWLAIFAKESSDKGKRARRKTKAKGIIQANPENRSPAPKKGQIP